MTFAVHPPQKIATLSKVQAVALFAAFAFAYFFSTLIRAVTATLAPELVREFALNARDLGLLAGGYFLGFSATQLPLGQWLDRFGPKKVLLSFLVFAVAGSVAFSMANSFATLLAARVLCGVGVSACLMAPLTAYRRWFAPASLMRANSWMLMVGAMGMVASTLPVQWLMPLVGWRHIFLGLAALITLAMVMIAWQVPAWETLPAAQDEHSGNPQAGYAEVWRHPYFRKFAPFGFFCTGGLAAMQTLWAAPWLVKVAQFTPLQAATTLFWLNVAMLLTFWALGSINPWLARNGYTVDRILAVTTPISLGLLAINVVAGGAISMGAAVLWVLFCVTGAAGSLAQPAVGLAFAPALAGRALSAFNLVVFVGIFCVQWGVGLLVDGFLALGATTVQAYQGALGVYLLCCMWAYATMRRAITP